jgi:hypothetical protein
MRLLHDHDGRLSTNGETTERDEDVGAATGSFFRMDDRRSLCEVRAGCIGRGRAGKTALFRTLSEGPVGDFFPSGLHVDAGDPREVAQMIREAEETQHILQTFGLPPTREAAQIRYYLYDGDQQRVVYKMREVIGQILTHTLPHSSIDQQARYDQYLRSLVDTHVLWVVVPCPPPDPTARDRRRYGNDLRITSAYLREALRLRTLPLPAAVVLVISKLDTLFGDANEARAILKDETLRNALGPLTHLIDTSAHVADAIILPVTSFGFGNAVLREREHDYDAPTPEPSDDPYGAEPTWLLKQGTIATPFNLDTLVLWTLHQGLLRQQEISDTGDLCRMLRDDLLTGDRWFVTVKADGREL